MWGLAGSGRGKTLDALLAISVLRYLFDFPVEMRGRLLCPVVCKHPGLSREVRALESTRQNEIASERKMQGRSGRRSEP